MYRDVRITSCTCSELTLTDDAAPEEDAAADDALFRCDDDVTADIDELLLDDVTLPTSPVASSSSKLFGDQDLGGGEYLLKYFVQCDSLASPAQSSCDRTIHGYLYSTVQINYAHMQNRFGWSFEEILSYSGVSRDDAPELFLIPASDVTQASQQQQQDIGDDLDSLK